jgi:hypothetical protein
VGARRGIWLFRVVFYGAALAFLAVHFWPGGDARPATTPDRSLVGSTSQGRAITLRVRDRNVRALDMTFSTRCTGGQVWVPRWWPAEGAPVHFHNLGRTFDVRERTDRDAPDGTRSRMDSWMYGRTSADGHSATGLARFVGGFSGGRYRRPMACDSGVVAWSVRLGQRS